MLRMVAAGAALIALAACGGGDREAEAPPQVSIDTPEGRVQVRAAEGAITGLPQGIPAYPGAEPLASVNVQGGAAGQQGAVVGLRTNDSPAEVINFYNDAALRARFAVTQQMTMGDLAMLTAERDGQGLSISATRADGATQIQIVAGRSR